MPLKPLASTGVSMGAPTKFMPMPPPHSLKPLPLVRIAPSFTPLTKSPVLGGLISPLAEPSLKQNQLPAGSRLMSAMLLPPFSSFWPSHTIGAVGTTGTRPSSLILASMPELPPDDDEEDDEPSE